MYKARRCAHSCASADRDVTYTASRNTTEWMLAETWSRILGVDRIGVHDDLLDLGADSLSGLRVAVAVAGLGHQLSPMDTITYPTIAQLAEYLGIGPKE